MSQSLLKRPNIRILLLNLFSDYWTLCGVLHRRNDFEQLIDWADRRRLTNVSRAYKSYLADEEDRLLRLSCRSPLAARLALIAVSINVFLSPPIYTVGYASQYSRKARIKLSRNMTTVAEVYGT